MALIEKKYQKLVKGFVFNKFRGDIDILKPGFRKLKQITKIPVLGTIPMIKMNLPEEDSLDAKPKEIVWTKNNIAKIDKELDKLAKTVKNNLDRSEEHTSELQSQAYLVCRLLLEKKKMTKTIKHIRQ